MVVILFQLKIVCNMSAKDAKYIIDNKELYSDNDIIIAMRTLGILV